MNFCTHFDSNYLPHAISLAESLNTYLNDFSLFMMCMDDESFSFLNSNPIKNTVPIHYSKMENYFPELLVAKQNRNRVEYFFTCSPAVCNYIIKNNLSLKSITYLDSDLYFFSSPKIIFDKIKNKSISIIEHRFNWITKRQIKYGKFNVGWITFKNDNEGLKCISDWMSDCLDWCYQKVEEDRFGDQKYLDKWPKKYKNIHIIKCKGANVAIWNIGNYKFSKKDNQIMVDNEKLIFYHYANLNQIDMRCFKTNLSRVFVRLNNIIKNDIYLPYVKKLLNNNVLNKTIESKKDNHIKGGFKIKVINFFRYFNSLIFEDRICV